MRRLLFFAVAAVMLVAPAFSAPQLPTSRVVLPFAVSNTVLTPDSISEVGWVTNVCPEAVEVIRRLNRDDGQALLVSKEELSPWEKWSFNLRDLLLQAGLPVSEDTVKGYVVFWAPRDCLAIADSFSADSGAISGQQMYSPNGECGACTRRGVNYIDNIGGFTGSLIINWVPEPSSDGTFHIVARDDGGKEVKHISLHLTKHAVTIPFGDFDLPEGLRSATFEVICPTSSCYVGVEFSTVVLDENGFSLRHEEVPGWSLCLRNPPGVNPHCAPAHIEVLSGTLNAVCDVPFEAVFKVEGSPLIVWELLEALPEGLTFAVLDSVEHIYRISGTPTVAGKGRIKFGNSCSNTVLEVVATNEPVPSCDDVALSVVSGFTSGAVGEPFGLIVNAIAGTPPFNFTANLPTGLVAQQTDSDTFSISGTPTAAGDGNITVTNACSDEGIDIHIDSTPPPQPGSCSPGYWKNHPDSWGPTGLAPSDDYNATFGVNDDVGLTLMGALERGGGGKNALGRHAVAALLGASYPIPDYPYSPTQVVAIVRNAYIHGTFDAAIGLLEPFEEPCPLN